MDTSRVRTQNGRDFAVGGFIVALILVGISGAYFRSKYGDTPDPLVPWYAANIWLNAVVGLLAGAIIGWFVGISIPVGPQRGQRAIESTICPDCRRPNAKGSRFCSQCGASLH